jgi:hypothetical protein
MNLLNQIRGLQLKGESFAIELASGRIIQIYDPFNVATVDGHGPGKTDNLVMVLRADGFDLIMADQIAAISAGIHPEESARNKKRMDEIKARFGDKNEIP